MHVIHKSKSSPFSFLRNLWVRSHYCWVCHPQWTPDPSGKNQDTVCKEDQNCKFHKSNFMQVTPKRKDNIEHWLVTNRNQPDTINNERASFRWVYLRLRLTNIREPHSEDDLRHDCQNVRHYCRQQSFKGLSSPNTITCNLWVETGYCPSCNMMESGPTDLVTNEN